MILIHRHFYKHHFFFFLHSNPVKMSGNKYVNFTELFLKIVVPCFVVFCCHPFIDLFLFQNLEDLH